MRNASIVLMLVVIFTGCYKESGEIKLAHQLGPVYPEIQLEPEWIYQYEYNDMNIPFFMLETDELLIYSIDRDLVAINIQTGEKAWALNFNSSTYPNEYITPIFHLFEYSGFLYFFTGLTEVLKIDIIDGSLVEVIPLPARGPLKSTPLESFFRNGRLILDKYIYDFDVHQSSLRLYEFNLDTRETKIVGEIEEPIFLVLSNGRQSSTDFDQYVTYKLTLVRHDTTGHMAKLYKFDLSTNTHEVVWQKITTQYYFSDAIYVSNSSVFIPNWDNNNRFLALDRLDYSIKWDITGTGFHPTYFSNNKLCFFNPYGSFQINDFETGQELTNIEFKAYLTAHGFDKHAKYVFLAMNRNAAGQLQNYGHSYISVIDAISRHELTRIRHPSGESLVNNFAFIGRILVTQDGKRIIIKDQSNIYSYLWPEIL